MFSKEEIWIILVNITTELLGHGSAEDQRGD